MYQYTPVRLGHWISGIPSKKWKLNNIADEQAKISHGI